MDQIITSHTVGYNERDLLLSKPSELLGRVGRIVGTGQEVTVIGVVVQHDQLLSIAGRGIAGHTYPEISPDNFELVTA
jgi:hypothetical protein